MTVSLRIGLLAAAMLIAAPAAVAQSSDKPVAKRQCFFPRNVNGFSAVDRDTVNVRVGVRDVFQLKLLGPCPDIDWTWRIGIVSRGSSVCTGLDATLIVPSNIGSQRCEVRAVRKLTPDEIAALPARQKP